MVSNTNSDPFVLIENLKVEFRGAKETVKAVNGVNLSLKPGESTSLLGESGSGKSVTLRSILRILPENRTKITGSIKVDGQDILAMSNSDLEQFRGGMASMIFQEPGLALDPVYRVGDQIIETVVRHTKVDRASARKVALKAFEMVQIPSPESRLDNYPHEMSGGMLQRVMIALAISCSPKLLLADEPTTALDATVQIQVLLLLRDMQKQLGMTTIFVTHDVGVAAEISDRVAVMYAGKIVEQGAASDVLKNPGHPYTKGLLDSTVHGSMRGTRIEAISGAPPDLANLPQGCAFAPRCKSVQPDCTKSTPSIVKLSEDHSVQCLYPEQVNS